ncbi:MAG: hypothetical protein K1X71_07795 [Pirellulales bacterium]|nr:hypothetical protein [Pirellulales bacterium]
MTPIDRRVFLSRCAATAAVAGLADLDGAERSAGAEAATDQASPAGRNGFCFLHTYEASGSYWAGLEKAGLVRPHNGVRLINSSYGDDSARFNQVARVGGALHRIVSGRSRPLVIDRVAGGIVYHPYQFDAELIRAYDELLGDKFLGGQIHETISNTHNDWDRFLSVDPKYAEDPIEAAAVRDHLNHQTIASRYLEYGTVDDYDGRRFPRDFEALWQETVRNFQAQADRVAGRCCYAEGSAKGELVWHAFYKLGARSCLAEVGPWASHRSQFMVASLRGAAKAAGKPWGVFFAPWGPQGCTSFLPLGESSWQIPPDTWDKSVWPIGPELGPSSALQRRSFFHTYLSGAHTLHEEWGAECNLTNWDSGELSSYGRVTRDLLDFQDQVGDVGEPFTPIALVLDATVVPPFARAGKLQQLIPPRAIDLDWAQVKEALYPPAESAAAKGASELARGEVACYAPCPYAELFDVTPSDAPEAVWSDYREVIAIGDGHAPACAVRGPIDAQIARLKIALEKWSPLTRTGDMLLQINRRAADQAWIIGLHNPYGAYRGDVANLGSILEADCAQRETLRMKSPIKSARALHAWPAGSGIERQGDELVATVGPGGTLIVEVMT